jgi:hypothetical protein
MTLKKGSFFGRKGANPSKGTPLGPVLQCKNLIKDYLQISLDFLNQAIFLYDAMQIL